MADDPIEALREAARHRGLKLLRSRRRKPGSGDYGRFGLSDASGAPLLGVGKDGLTATAEEVARYLRAGAAATWAASARATPARARTARDKPAVPAPAGDRAERAPRTEPVARSEPAPAKAAAAPVAAEPVAAEPSLSIRRAKPGDAAALATLIGGDSADIEPAMRAGSAIFVADRGGIVGCAACQPIATPQHGPIGRLTLIFVAADARRQGVGTALADAAQRHLRKQRCTLIEAMSDIELRNAHGFFRAIGFRKSSYRFTIG